MKCNCLNTGCAAHGKLPVVSGTDLVRLVRKLGYQQVRQRGSHIKMRREMPGSACHQIIVPRHTEIDRGKLNALLTEIGFANHLAKDQLVQMIH